MRLKITEPQGYGDRYGMFHPQGSVIDVPEAIAVKLLQHQMAVLAPPIVEKKVIETMEAAPTETVARTTKPKAKGRR